MDDKTNKFVFALKKLSEQKSKKIQKGFEMLKANYRAEGRTITAEKLAKAAGYDNYGTGNEQYGSFAHELCNILEIEPEQTRDGKPIWTFAICDASDEKDRHGYFQWALKEEVALALEQLEIVSPIVVEEKIARICWNDNDWKKPSGEHGKSQNEGAFEAENGFGFEEWLFDFDTLVDGYKYAFLQPVNTTSHAHAGRRYAIHLYVYDKAKSENISIAKIASVECLTEKEAKSAYNKLHQNSVLDRMARDVENVGGNKSLLTTLPPINCFNVRFKPQDVEFVSDSDFHSLHELTRYKLYENKHYSKRLFVGCNPEDQLLDDVTGIMNADASNTEKEILAKARIGQGKYRKNVISVWGCEVCAVTLNPIREVLVASHIKAWKDCSDSERLDGANGILLEATLDKLFDLHLMTLFHKKKNEFEIKYSPSVVSALPKYYKDLSGFSISIDRMSNDEAVRFSRYMEYHNALFKSKCEE